MVNTWLTKVVSYGSRIPQQNGSCPHTIHFAMFMNVSSFWPIMTNFNILYYPPFAKLKTVHCVGHKPHLDVNFNLIVTNHYTKNVIL